MVSYNRRETLRLLGLGAGALVLNASGLEAVLGCGAGNSQQNAAVASAPRKLEKNDPAYGSASRPPHSAGPYLINGDAVAEMQNLAGLLMHNDGKLPADMAPRIEQGKEGPYLGVHFSEQTAEGTNYLIRACQLADRQSNDFIVTKAEAQAALDPVKKPIFEKLQTEARGQQKTK